MKLYEPAPPARKDELANVQDGIAVIVDGDTCPVVVESGMYAYIKNNTHGLAEGLYKNISDSAFPTSGGTADGTVFEADSTGGLNALNASLTITTPTVTKTENIKNNSVVVAKKCGHVVCIYMDVYAVGDTTAYNSIANIDVAPENDVYFVMVDSNDGPKMCKLTTSGILQIHGTVANRNYMGTLTFISQS